MNTAGTPESPLKKEGRLFSEWLTRFANALVNKVFDLTPQASAIRSVWLVILFFLTGFVISLIYYPLGLWFQRIQDIFLFVFNSAYRATYQGDPLLSLVSFAWQVFIDPRNLHFLPLMLASFFISLQSAAIYLADIFNLEDVSIARKHISEVSIGLGTDEPIRFTKGVIAEESEKSPNFLIGGPGKVIVDLDSAVLFEKPDGTPHVIGPTGGEPGGKATIQGFERFREAIDLRDHFIDLRNPDDPLSSVKSRSRDGIPITAADVSFIFSILRKTDEEPATAKPAKQKRLRKGWFRRKSIEKETKKEPDPYTFSKKAIQNIVYKALSQVTPGQENPSEYKFSWITNMTSLVRSELGGFMGKRDLTAYLASTNYPERDRALNRENDVVEQARRVIPPHEDPPQPQNVPPVPDFTPRYKITNLFNEFTSDFTKKAQERGVELRWIGIGTWRTPISNVAEKHLEAWKISRENQANGSDDEINGLRNGTVLTRNMELIQEIPLASYHQAMERTKNPSLVIFGVLVDFRKQLLQARDLWIHKGETPPNVVVDAIRHLDHLLFRVRQSSPFRPDDEVTAEEDDNGESEPEPEVPGPGAVALDTLVRMVGGDVATTNRLIEYEQSLFPNDPPDTWIERAIARLERDRRG